MQKSGQPMPAFFILIHSANFSLSGSRHLPQADTKMILRPRQILLISFFTLCSLLLTWLSGLAAFPYEYLFRQDTVQPPVPSPTYDPLAIPTLPGPSDPIRSRQEFIFLPLHALPRRCRSGFDRCLPHGLGGRPPQLLGARLPHGGRPQDEGFPVPTIIPAIISPYDLLSRYPDLESLVSYLSRYPPAPKTRQARGR